MASISKFTPVFYAGFYYSRGFLGEFLSVLFVRVVCFLVLKQIQCRVFFLSFHFDGSYGCFLLGVLFCLIYERKVYFWGTAMLNGAVQSRGCKWTTSCRENNISFLRLELTAEKGIITWMLAIHFLYRLGNVMIPSLAHLIFSIRILCFNNKENHQRVK